MANLAELALHDQPAHLTAATKDFSEADIKWIVSRFDIDGWVEVAPFPGRGNINIHTYDVRIGGQNYLLQKVNCDVFTVPERVMTSMTAVIESQRVRLAEGYNAPHWVPIELIPTRRGVSYLDLTDSHGRNVWRLMVRIPDVATYKSLSEVKQRKRQLQLAEEVGRGLAVYADLTDAIAVDQIEGSLPGYRDTALYYRQFHAIVDGTEKLADNDPILPAHPELREATRSLFRLAHSREELERRLADDDVRPFVELVRAQEPFAMDLWEGLNAGRIRKTLIHGDTKIENFLFCPRTSVAKSLVDLDTIMPFTWLADWGDMVRSLCNVAGEREQDLTKIMVDTDIYLAVAKGFIQTAQSVPEAEIELMPRAVQIIALELGMRFLTDYLRGDNYFQLGPGDPPDLNKTRARVQLTLFRRLVELGDEFAEKLLAHRAAKML